jgi:hypothetical protein
MDHSVFEIDQVVGVGAFRQFLEFAAGPDSRECREREVWHQIGLATFEV